VSTPKFLNCSIIWIFSNLRAKTILEQKACTDLASEILAIALIGLKKLKTPNELCQVHFLVDNAQPYAKLYDFVISFEWFDLIFTLNKKEQCCHSVKKNYVDCKYFHSLQRC
jgi:hypothetical protein